MPVWRRSPPPALGRALAGGLRASARVVRRSMECLSPDLAVSPIRPSSAARFASLRLASRRRAARAPSAGSRRFPRLGQCPAGGHAALQDGVGGRATVMDSQFFPDMLPNLRDLPSESSRPTPDIRLFALIRAIVSPWKGISEPPSSDTVKYRKFSSIPLPCPKKQGDAGGHRRAITGLHRAVPLGMRGDPLRAWGTADRRSCRARFAGRAPRACRRAG